MERCVCFRDEAAKWLPEKSRRGSLAGLLCVDGAFEGMRPSVASRVKQVAVGRNGATGELKKKQTNMWAGRAMCRSYCTRQRVTNGFTPALRWRTFP